MLSHIHTCLKFWNCLVRLFVLTSSQTLSVSKIIRCWISTPLCTKSWRPSKKVSSAAAAKESSSWFRTGLLPLMVITFRLTKGNLMNCFESAYTRSTENRTCFPTITENLWNDFWHASSGQQKSPLPLVTWSVVWRPLHQMLGGWHFLQKGDPKDTGVHKFLERKIGGS